MLYTNPFLNKFFQRVDSDPGKKIIIETSGKSLTLKELADKSQNLANNLSSQGFKKGDRVLILVRPGVSLVIFILAVMRLGGSIVLADPGMGQSVFESRINLANPRWAFVESLLFPIQKLSFLKSYLRSKKIAFPEFSSLGNAKIVRLGPPLPGSFNTLSFNTLLNSASKSTAKQQEIGSNAEIAVIFTSGTTDLPKGVVHTVGSINAALDLIIKITSPKENEIFYANLPHFIILAVSLGVPSVIPKNQFSPHGFFEDIEKYKPSTIFGPPAEFIELVRYCQTKQKKFPKEIEKIFLGSAPVYSGFLKRLIKVLPKTTQVTCIYGMTEILPVSTMDGRKKAIWMGDGDLVGNTLDQVKVRLNSDRELVLSGPNLFEGYLGQNSVKEIASGDLARLEGENIILVGRKKDMIIKGNYNIYPGLFEPTIQKIPGVAASALVGIRDSELEDEKIVLAIEPNSFDDPTLIKRVEKLLRSGTYSIDTHAFPDKILSIKLPRRGRQLKIDKIELKKIITEKYL